MPVPTTSVPWVPLFPELKSPSLACYLENTGFLPSCPLPFGLTSPFFPGTPETAAGWTLPMGQGPATFLCLPLQTCLPGLPGDFLFITSSSPEEAGEGDTLCYPSFPLPHPTLDCLQGEGGFPLPHPLVALEKGEDRHHVFDREAGRKAFRAFLPGRPFALPHRIPYPALTPPVPLPPSLPKTSLGTLEGAAHIPPPSQEMT